MNLEQFKMTLLLIILFVNHRFYEQALIFTSIINYVSDISDTIVIKKI